MPSRGTRTAARQGFDVDVRLAWLEGDADELESAVKDIGKQITDCRNELVAAIKAGQERTDQRFTRFAAFGLTLLGSFITILVGLVVNLVVV